MGNYLFERSGDEVVARSAHSLEDDVSSALAEIDWVDRFAVNAERSNDELVSVDVLFEEEWPDLRTANPDQVSEVFARYMIRVIPNPMLSAAQASADDPLSTDDAGIDLSEGMDLFQFED